MTEQFTGTLPPILLQHWKLSLLSLHHRSGALTPVLQCKINNTLFWRTNSFSTRICFRSRPRPNLKNSLFNLFSTFLIKARSLFTQTPKSPWNCLNFETIFRPRNGPMLCPFDLDYSSWPRVKRSSQESRPGTRNTGSIVNSSETLSFDPSSPVSNRVVRRWSCARSSVAFPLPSYNELSGRAHPASPSLFPSVHSCFWVFYASGELYLRGEWSLTWINCISLPAASPFADSSTDDSWWSNQGTESVWHFFFLCFCDYARRYSAFHWSFQLRGLQFWIGLRFFFSFG